MNVNEYTVTNPVIILDTLFLPYDLIYIESYDPVNGKPQRVFAANRKLLGTISSSFYWAIKKELKAKGEQD
jgi:hypothetical protein